MITNTQITKCRWYSTLYTAVKVKRFVKHTNHPKCKETVCHVKAQPESNRMLIETENILKIEADILSILNQMEEEKKEYVSRHS